MFLHFLIDHRRNINEIPYQSSLMRASEYNNIPLVEFIVSKEETDIGLKDRSGKTAIDFASTDEMKAILTKSQNAREKMSK